MSISTSPSTGTPTHRADPFGTAALLRLAAPLVVSVACFALTLFTDRTLLMWFDPQQSGASMAAGNLYWTLVCVPITALGFVTPLVAAASAGTGRGVRNPAARLIRKQRFAALVWQTLWITLAFVPVLLAIAVAAPSIFAAAGHDASLAAEEAIYLRRLMWVAPASMLEAGLSGYFVGRRITGPILWINIATAILNVLLDAWLIFGGLGVPALGIAGAAMATAIAMWFKSSVYLVMIIRTPSFRRGSFAINRSDDSSATAVWRPNRTIMAEIMWPGSTLGIGQLVRSGLMSYVLMGIGSVSIVGLAASTAAMSLYQLIAIPMIGLATAVTVLVSQATGMSGGTDLDDDRRAPAERPSSAGSIILRGVRVGGVYMAAFAVVMLLAPDTLLRISIGPVSDQNLSVYAAARPLLMIAAVYGLSDVVVLIVTAGLKGLGWTMSLLLSICFAAVLAWSFSLLESAISGGGVIFWWIVLLVWVAGQAAAIAATAAAKSRRLSSRTTLWKGRPVATGTVAVR